MEEEREGWRKRGRGRGREGGVGEEREGGGGREKVRKVRCMMRCFTSTTPEVWGQGGTQLYSIHVQLTPGSCA